MVSQKGDCRSICDKQINPGHGLISPLYPKTPLLPLYRNIQAWAHRHQRLPCRHPTAGHWPLGEGDKLGRGRWEGMGEGGGGGGLMWAFKSGPHRGGPYGAVVDLNAPESSTNAEFYLPRVR